MDIIIVTNWEAVEKGDFYLSNDWIENVGKETMREARRLQVARDLFIAYEVTAKNYVLFSQMDSTQIFIDGERNNVMTCEGAVIDNNHQDKWEGESY